MLNKTVQRRSSTSAYMLNKTVLSGLLNVQIHNLSYKYKIIHNVIAEWTFAYPDTVSQLQIQYFIVMDNALVTRQQELLNI